MCGEPVSSQLFHCTETTSTTLAREHTQDSPQAAFPSHPITQHPSETASMCAQFFLPPPVATDHLSEAFCIHPRDKQVSLVPPPKPPSPHHSLWSAMLHKLAGGPRDVTAAKPASQPTACKITSHYWARKESPNPTNVLTWSWHEGTGDLPGSTCSGAQLSQARSVSPKSSCSSAHREDLSAFCKCHVASALHMAKNTFLHVATCRELTHPKEGTTSRGNALVPHRGCSSLPPSQTNTKTTCYLCSGTLSFNPSNLSQPRVHIICLPPSQWEGELMLVLIIQSIFSCSCPLSFKQLCGGKFWEVPV